MADTISNMIVSRDLNSDRAWVLDANLCFSAIRGSDGVWREEIPSPMELKDFSVEYDAEEAQAIFTEALIALGRPAAKESVSPRGERPAC